MADQVNINSSLRPQNIDQVIGRENEKRTIKLMAKSALKQGAVIDHILFYGPPGLGKTTMSNVVADLMGARMHVTSGPAIEKQGDLAAILSGLEEGSILFIDEIHRLRKNVEEILYPAMEDGYIDVVIGSGGSAKSIRIELPRFSLIGATTRLSMLSAPLRDRFGAHFHLDFYSDQEIEDIVRQKSSILKMEMTDQAVKLLASRSRRTARVAVRMVKRSADKLVVEGQQELDAQMVHELFEILGIDEYGLDKQTRKYLGLLSNSFAGKPVGLSTISAALGEESNTVADVIEPFLLREGFIMKTPRGRIPTDKTIKLFS